MTIRQVEANGRIWQVDYGPEREAAARLRVIWQARLVDEHDQQLLEPPYIIESESGLQPVSARGGLIGLTGVPTRRYPLLAVALVPVEVRIEVPGYLPVSLADAVAAAPDHPASFTPVGPAQPVEMQGLPLAINGTVRRVGTGGLTPVAGATVSLVAYWPVMPLPGAVPPPQLPAEIVEIRPALAEAYAIGTPVRRVTLLAAGTPTTLGRFAARGATVIELESRAGLAAGTLLAIEPSHPDLSEFVRIATVEPEPPAPLPGRVTLETPLGFDHLQGQAVELRTVGLAGPQRFLDRAVIPGGVSLFVDSAAGLDTTGFLEIVTGGASRVHRVRAISGLTDADGVYRLPPLHRVARAWIDAGDGISVLPAPLVFEPGRGPEPARLDIELPP